MEQERFDRMVRLFGRATTRRAGIGTLAALAAGALGRSPEQADAKPGKAGPCGNGSQKANQCKKHSDCCTGYCNKGLCRGVELGGTCSTTRKCRGTAVCQDGRCVRKNNPGPGPGPTPTSCTPENCASGCCNGTICVAYASQTTSQCGTGGAACAGCTGSDVCNTVDGTCTLPCDSTTCQNGCCQNGVCQAGTTSAACGGNGSICNVCVSPESCLGGGCAI
jgi:hypothetical protein